MVDYLTGLSPKDLASSKRLLELLKGRTVEKSRWDSKRKELYLGFSDGTRLFVDHIEDSHDISIHGGLEAAEK